MERQARPMTFKLNMSDKEAESKEFEYPPSGEYLCRITDLEIKEVSKAGDNFGKPFWKLSLTVEDGPYEGRTIPTSVMLYDGALYTIKNLCEAVHPEFIEGKGINLPTVENGNPDPSPWLGELVKIKGVKYAAGTLRRDKTTREFDEFQIRFRPAKSDKKNDVSGLPLPS